MTTTYTSTQGNIIYQGEISCDSWVDGRLHPSPGVYSGLSPCVPVLDDVGNPTLKETCAYTVVVGCGYPMGQPVPEPTLILSLVAGALLLWVLTTLNGFFRMEPPSR